MGYGGWRADRTRAFAAKLGFGRAEGARTRAARAAPHVLGNQAALQLLRGRSLPLSSRGATTEQEATRLSARATGSSALASRAEGDAVSAATGDLGAPLPRALRREFEGVLSADLGEVRIHDDERAHTFARSVGAKAATIGAHVHFAPGRFAPEMGEGRELLHHELVHTLQPEARHVVHRSPDDDRLHEVERLLASVIITDDYRMQLELERSALIARGAVPSSALGSFGMGGSAFSPLMFGDPTQLPGSVSVVTMSDAEYEQLTGLPASSLPEQAPELPSPWPSTFAGGTGVGTQFMPTPNWYYRVLSADDPAISAIMGGADLLPKPLAPGFNFQPAESAAEMTFRHLRPGGNVLQIGTDRISTAGELGAFDTILADRGTGELVRVDLDRARQLGREFLENGDIVRHLDEFERQTVQELEAARAAGRGRNFIMRLENRLQAVARARELARAFHEGQGVGSIPSEAISPVEGDSLAEAVAGERALLGRMRFVRYGGRVLLVVGAGFSIYRIASAPEGQRARVATQEAGGWAFSLAGGAAGAKAGAALGGALGFETGPGAVISAAIGGIIGGLLGFTLGEHAADQVYETVTEGPQDLYNWMDRGVRGIYGIPF